MSIIVSPTGKPEGLLVGLFSTIMESAIIKTVQVLNTLRLKNDSDNLYKLSLKHFKLNHRWY